MSYCMLYWVIWLRMTMALTFRGDHGHDANVAKVNRKKVSAACKRKAADDLFDRPCKIMRSVLAENFPPIFTESDKELIRRNMYNARQKILPFKKPRSISAVHLVWSEMNLVTCKDELFLLVNDTDHNIVIFSCQTNLDVLKSMETIYVDGTFEYIAQNFTSSYLQSMAFRMVTTSDCAARSYPTKRRKVINISWRTWSTFVVCWIRKM